MSENRSEPTGNSRDFRDQFKSVADFQAALSKNPKIPSLIRAGQNTYGRHHGLNKHPFARPERQRRQNQHYNPGRNSYLF